MLLVILNPQRSCKCDKFEQNEELPKINNSPSAIEHFNGFGSPQDIVKNNCSILKSESKLINNLLTKTCNAGNKNMTDREHISIVNSCRDFTEMEIFNFRESNSWCAGIPEPNKSNTSDNKKAISYPVVGKIILNGNYYLIGNIEKPKDTVLSDLKLDTYINGTSKNYAEKL